MQIAANMPRVAYVLAFVMAGAAIVSAVSGPIVLLPFALIPLVAGVGILRRKVWSAYGFAAYLFAQIVAFIAVYRGSAAVELIATIALIVILGCVFLFAGRSMASRGGQRGRPLPLTSCAKWMVGIAAAITTLLTVAYASPPRTSGPIATTVTMLAEHPEDYVGRWVSVKSQVILGRGPLILTEGDYRINVSEPGSSEVGKAPFDLIDDANWQRLNEAVAPVPPPYRGGKVIAVVEGRFDSKAASWWRRLFHIQAGYGHRGLYAHRIVIHRVTSVEVVPNP